MFIISPPVPKIVCNNFIKIRILYEIPAIIQQNFSAPSPCKSQQNLYHYSERYEYDGWQPQVRRTWGWLPPPEEWLYWILAM